MTKTETTNTSITILFSNNTKIKSFTGFTDGIYNPETTAGHFIEILIAFMVQLCIMIRIGKTQINNLDIEIKLTGNMKLPIGELLVKLK